MLGFGSFASASRFCSAFDKLRDDLRVRRRGELNVPLAEQRRLFLTRWRSLMGELVAAQSGALKEAPRKPGRDLRSDRAEIRCSPASTRGKHRSSCGHCLRT